MAYYSLEDLYKFMNPAISPGSAGLSNDKATTVVPFPSFLKNVILGSSTVNSFTPWLAPAGGGSQQANETAQGATPVSEKPQKGLFDLLKDGFSNASNEKDAFNITPKDVIGATYFALAGGGQVVEGQNSALDFGNLDYWGPGVKSLGDVIPSLKSKDSSKNDDFLAMTFLSRDPYVSPATRGTPEIDFFLNYTPPSIASQMTPFLDVEFQLLRAYQGSPSDASAFAGVNMSSPSLLRFLMGSKNLSDKAISPNDAAMENGSITIDKNGAMSVLAGMEMFLMPQTLTNMDDIDDLTNRVTRPKPFLPFASIEGVDIKVANAGAGKFAHRTASLRLKIHDKGRLSEISEFITVGGQGYKDALVWLTYGWMTPRLASGENEYFDFINGKMLQRDCYKVMNTNFQFDAAGQVTLGIELVSHAAKSSESYMVSGDKGLKGKMDDLKAAADAIQEIMRKYSGKPKFNFTPAAEQVLNAAASGGSFSDLKDVDVAKTVELLLSSLEKGKTIEKSDYDALKSSLDKLQSGGAAKGYGYGQAAADAQTSVINKLQSLANVPDPFLAGDGVPAPTGNKKEPTVDPSSRIGKYFNIDLAQEIDKYRKGSSERNAKLEAKRNDKQNPILSPKLDPVMEVVSFGKLFLNFMVPAARDSNPSCQELHVYFYSMNDSCGPMSNLNIAEFPIDMTSFTQAYAQLLKDSGGDSLTLLQFLGIAIETQFTDQRAIGYGQNSFYKPWDPSKPRDAEKVDDKAAAAKVEVDMNAWISRYGQLKIPAIEMYVETSVGTSSDAPLIDALRSSRAVSDSTPDPVSGQKNPRLIKKIHIYDKQATPHKVVKKITRGDGGVLRVGEVDENAIDQKLKSKLNGIDASNRQAVLQEMKRVLALQVKGQSSQDQAQKNLTEALKAAGLKDADAQELTTSLFPGQGETFDPIKNRSLMKSVLMKSVPTITIGSNGTMVLTAQASSKTDGALGAMRITNAMKGKTSPGSTMSPDGLSSSGGLPVSVSPMQLSMTTMGVPTANLYQQFFIDFDTGVSIDNLYSAMTIQHTLAPGKFTTQWTFSYQDGYAKYKNPPTPAMLVSGQLSSLIDKELEAMQKPEDKKK